MPHTPTTTSTSRNEARLQRRGAAAIYVVLILVALMGFVSLAVDYGRVQLAKAELQLTADAAARAAISGLSISTDEARSRALTVASANTCDGVAVLLDPEPAVPGEPKDIEFGIWNAAARQFVPGGTSAVRINARRTAARHNAIPLVFAKLVGKTTCDVHASAVAVLTTGMPPGFIGLNSMTMKNSFATSYNSSLGTAPDRAHSLNHGMLASNGAITAVNSETVGTVILGPHGTHNLTLDHPATVLEEDISVPIPDFSGAPASNPGGVPQNFTVNGTRTLAGGTYYFTSITLSNNAMLTFSGPATVYINGNVTFANRGEVRAYDQIPGNLTIYQKGAGSVFGGNTANNITLTADITAPQTDFLAKNDGMLYGRGIFRTLEVRNSAEFYADEALPRFDMGAISITLVK